MNKVTLSIGMLCLAAVTAGVAHAQNPQPAPGRGGRDSNAASMRWQGSMRPGTNPARRQQLLAQIQERFAERVQTRLGLTNQQMDRLRAEMRSNRDAHQRLQGQEQDIRQAIGDQLRPGIAANQDSLSHLLDALAANHVTRAQLEQQELRDLSFLTPVQKAQLLLMRQMLLQRVETIREGRMSGAGRPGFGGRQSPPAGQEPGPE